MREDGSSRVCAFPPSVDIQLRSPTGTSRIHVGRYIRYVYM